MALVGIEPETLVSEPDALTTRPPEFINAYSDSLHFTSAAKSIYRTMNIP